MASPTPHVLTSASSTEESGEEARREKEELIGKILELQNTLHDLTQRVNSVKEENSKLKPENEVSRTTLYGGNMAFPHNMKTPQMSLIQKFYCAPSHYRF